MVDCVRKDTVTMSPVQDRRHRKEGTVGQGRLHGVSLGNVFFIRNRLDTGETIEWGQRWGGKEDRLRGRGLGRGLTGEELVVRDTLSITELQHRQSPPMKGSEIVNK